MQTDKFYVNVSNLHTKEELAEINEKMIIKIPLIIVEVGIWSPIVW